MTDEPKSEDAVEPAVIRGRYRLLSRISQGAQAETFLGEDLESGDRVVVKRCSMAKIKEWKALELFRRECDTLRQLDHPAVPVFVDAFNTGGEHGEPLALYLVQQYIEGEDLATLLKNRRRWTESQALELCRQCLEVLDYLHTLSPPVVHRDIKPANLILRPDGQLALVDFGAIQEVLPSATQMGSTIVGTTGYMPPEQLLGRATPATDLYAFGATMVHMLSHVHPADLPIERLRLKYRDRVSISDTFARFLDRLLAPMVEDRFASARAALQQLKGYRFWGKLDEPGGDAPDELDQRAPDKTPQGLAALIPLKPKSARINVQRRDDGLSVVIEPRQRKDITLRDLARWGQPGISSGLALIVVGLLQNLAPLVFLPALVVLLWIMLYPPEEKQPKPTCMLLGSAGLGWSSRSAEEQNAVQSISTDELGEFRAFRQSQGEEHSWRLMSGQQVVDLGERLSLSELVWLARVLEHYRLQFLVEQVTIDLEASLSLPAETLRESLADASELAENEVLHVAEPSESASELAAMESAFALEADSPPAEPAVTEAADGKEASMASELAEREAASELDPIPILDSSEESASQDEQSEAIVDEITV